MAETPLEPLPQEPIDGLSSNQEPTSLTLAEIEAIAIRSKFRNNLGFISAALQIVSTTAFIIVSVLLLSSSGSEKDFSVRSDCKSTYSSILAAPVTLRDNLQANVSALSSDLESQLGSALLGLENGTPISQTVIDSFTNAKDNLDIKRAELQTAITKVKKLPSLAHAETQGFVFDGEQYPACPSAS